MKRITNEQREAIVRKAVAERDAILSGETEDQRMEVVAAWNDLPADLKAHPAMRRLYLALGGIAMERLQPRAHGVLATCGWQEQDPDGYTPGTYESACGEMWSFTEGGVKENNVRFCQGCGKPVEVVPFPQAVDEDAADGVSVPDHQPKT